MVKAIDFESFEPGFEIRIRPISGGFDGFRALLIRKYHLRKRKESGLKDLPTYPRMCSNLLKKTYTWLRRQKYQQDVRTGDFMKKTQKNMGTPAAADAPWSSSPQHACLTWTGWLYRTTASPPPRLQNAPKSRFAHMRRGAARNAVGATRAGKRREALLHARVV